MLGQRGQPDGQSPHPKSRRRVRQGVLALFALGTGALLAVAFWQPAPGWQATLHRLLELAFPVPLLTGVVLGGYEFFVRHWLTAELARLSGPRIQAAQLPQQVMRTFLDSIYGENEANRDVATGVLGGEGIVPLGGDLTISTRTEVNLELSAVDHKLYHLTTSVAYRFKEHVRADRFIVFATCNALLRDSIVAGCRLPLFELWFVPDGSLFQDSVDDMATSVRLGIEYLDHGGHRHRAPSHKLVLREVKSHRWAEYLSFFREDIGPLAKLNAHDHLADLRMFECDLNDIADDHHTVRAIEQLATRVTALQRIDDGGCYWQAPYPCYVDRITFDVAELGMGGTNEFEFYIDSFTFRSNTAMARWVKAKDLPDLDVRSWLLPGHGVLLRWRSPRDWDHR
ncbi:hypothetical protein [Amycolatopsis taiwanensis]|uniref:Uncharacterized protein n=1 Tax=Amycolatopsis taiwanensis TaxID=342230 RepID=A0A9W6VEN4_9PSEU|nr:hypothetical protein [Amycolatopsis taiwanensis]GLY63984.1 hypothetical protein Atai01_06030 [Amycolatopsis taiwanensis]